MGTLDGFNQIETLGQNDLVSKVITVINENSGLTNALLETGKDFQATEQLIGDLENLNGGVTLVEQVNYLYTELLNLFARDSAAIEFLSADPVPVNNIHPPLYFNTVLQTLMVWHEGDGRYYQTYGVNSANDGAQPLAVDWITPPVVPPVIPAPSASTCLTFTPALLTTEPRLYATFPSAEDILSAAFEADMIHYFTKGIGDSTDYRTYEISTKTFTEVSSFPFQIDKANVLVGADGESLFYLGGQDRNGIYNRTIYKISTLDGTYIDTGYTSTVPYYSDAVSYNAAGSVAYIFGGTVLFNGFQTIYSNKIYAVDLLTGEMEEAGVLPIALQGVAVTQKADSNGDIFLFGGRTSSSTYNNSLTTKIRKFNTATGLVEDVADLPESRAEGVILTGEFSYFYAAGLGPGADNCIRNVNSVTELYAFGNVWTAVPRGFVGINDLDHWAYSTVDCGYAAYLSNNGNLPATLHYLATD